MLRTVVACLLLILPAVLPAEDRASFVKAEIERVNENLTPESRSQKFAIMAQSSYAFYRGTNHLFWKDFVGDDRLAAFSSSQTKTWLQGDLHAYNFGSFHNDKDEVVYNVNDFDESLVADYQYDVLRLATSLVLIARLNDDLTPEEIADVVDEFSDAYRETLESYVGNDDETEVYFTEENTQGKLDDFLKSVGDDSPKKARRKMLSKWTDGNGRLAREGRYEAATDAKKQAIRAGWSAYQDTSQHDSLPSDHFEIKDLAERIGAGTGSYGTPRFYVLIEGPTSDGDDDRILDIKRQSRPTPFDYLSLAERQSYDEQWVNHAAYHQLAYRALTKHTDDYLGWLQIIVPDDDDVSGFYSVRERSPYKEAFPAWKDPNEDPAPDLWPDTANRFQKMAAQWGQILATDHARADKDFDEKYVSHSFEKAVTELLAGQQAEFRNHIREIALDHATTVQSDYESWQGSQAN